MGAFTNLWNTLIFKNKAVILHRLALVWKVGQLSKLYRQFRNEHVTDRIIIQYMYFICILYSILVGQNIGTVVGVQKSDSLRGPRPPTTSPIFYISDHSSHYI